MVDVYSIGYGDTVVVNSDICVDVSTMVIDEMLKYAGKEYQVMKVDLCPFTEGGMCVRINTGDGCNWMWDPRVLTKKVECKICISDEMLERFLYE